jgi:hypothetical protein
VPVRRVVQEVLTGGGLKLKIMVLVPKVTCRVVFGTETVILTVVLP